MKELSIEEKASRYDEAIKTTRKWYEANDNKGYRGIFEEIFPELKESDDERMRTMAIKAIRIPESRSCIKNWGINPDDVIAWLEKQGEQNNNEDADILYRFSFYSYKDEPNVIYLSGFYVNEEYRNKGIGTKILKVADEVTKSLDCRAIRLKTKKDSDAERLYQTHGYNSLSTEGKDEIWLEKQAEQKPADKVEPKFKVGDWIINNEHNNVAKVLEVNEQYRLDYCDTIGTVGVELIDNDYHLWTIKDAKDGDVLVNNDASYIVLFKRFSYSEDDIDRFKSYCHCREGVFSSIEDTGWCCNGFHLATKEQRDILMKAMTDAGWEFDFDKKKLKKIKLEPAWDEGDEKEIDRIIYMMEQLDLTESWSDCYTFLNSLKKSSTTKHLETE